ncbi:hypothetical protein NEUTE1DRAFT_99297 [Neurospora tetrasperma FGSC 2508]|uniref:Uncharacterized protein n=1 Tax=Neurospora tetrasperma (strain FGSC 2508 / ATCC MYA-4615 / P0657) TaxID=510951 RepID=F8MJB6_NEUT8|nr:uncharacterized protein NEUTE1DRAFT_99297 [Neurospora tetrasperma FGSC 2508]EGO59113.1 hypothetical protein NEUTE1DRAFT_99297 [Neurospora tetrasperma FGSC 2508]
MSMASMGLRLRVYIFGFCDAVHDHGYSPSFTKHDTLQIDGTSTFCSTYLVPVRPQFSSTEPQLLGKAITFSGHGISHSVPDLPLRPGLGGLQSQASIGTDVTDFVNPRSRPILFEASRRALLSAEVNILPNSMVEKQSPESAWSFSLGSTPSDAGSSVQVHADNGSTSLKRPHDGALTDIEPLAKRDRLIEELEQMAPTGSKAAIESLPTRQKEINVHGDPVAFTLLKASVPQLVEWGCIDVSITQKAEEQLQQRQ